MNGSDRSDGVDGDGSGSVEAVAREPADFDDLLARLGSEEAVAGAEWRDDLRDFAVLLASGRSLLFRDCLQAGFHRSPSAFGPWMLGSWWSDEPSPLLLSFDVQVRFQYRHLVLEVGEGLLRVAFRSLELHERSAAD